MRLSSKLIRRIFLLLSPLLLATTMWQCIILQRIFFVLCLVAGGEVRINDSGRTEFSQDIFVGIEGDVWFTSDGAIDICEFEDRLLIPGAPVLNAVTSSGREGIGNIIVGGNGTLVQVVNGDQINFIPNPTTVTLRDICQDFDVSGPLPIVQSPNVVTVGDSGTVMKSTDHGLTWSVLGFPDLTNLKTCELRGDYILVGGSSPFIYQSEDCGDTWEMIGVGYNSNSAGVEYNSNSNGPPGFNAIFFFDDSVGYIGGDFGALSKTTDGGNNWNPLFAPGFEAINDLFFISPDSGVAVGTNGIVRFTTDGGNTWEEDPEVTTLIGGKNIKKIIAIDEVTGRIIGDSLHIIFSTDSSIIPVELISFTASVNGNTVTLNWITATELNNSGFEVERQVGSKQSAVGKWEKVAFVEGHGTTTERNTYSFFDANLTANNYLYRLKQIDFNGEFEYSDVVEVEILPVQYALFQNYPNPFNPETLIMFNIPSDKTEFVSLIVYDLLGNEVKRLVYEERNQGSYQIVWDGTNESGVRVGSGVYLYGLETKSFHQYNKMVLLK